MRKTFYILLIFFVFKTNARQAAKDSTKQSFFRQLNISTIWFELGTSIPFKEKKINSLPCGMDKYLNKLKGGDMSAGFFSLGLYYKDKIGVEFVLFRNSNYVAYPTEFNNYLSVKYPNNYIKNIWGHSYSIRGKAYRICYKYHLKYFQIEPKIQLGFNNYINSDESAIFKEKGSNEFIEYSIKKESLKKTTIDYHLIIDVSKRVHFKSLGRTNVEFGVKTEVMMVPTSYRYTITETPYGMPEIKNEVIVKQNNPAWGIEAVVRLFFKKQ